MINIFSSVNSVEVEIVKQMLENNKITSVVLNQQDSSYHFGRIILYVQEKNAKTALKLIDTFDQNA